MLNIQGRDVGGVQRDTGTDSNGVRREATQFFPFGDIVHYTSSFLECRVDIGFTNTLDFSRDGTVGSVDCKRMIVW